MKNTKKISLILFSAAALLVCSCRENPKTEETTPTTQSETTDPVKKEVTPASSPDGVALNPAHGQPGHRCDISVGAPLNSASTPAKTNSETSDVMLDAGNSLPVGTLNPAHGQPGHRCDIKVGDPL